jgi:hypothetical protein
MTPEHIDPLQGARSLLSASASSSDPLVRAHYLAACRCTVARLEAELAEFKITLGIREQETARKDGGQLAAGRGVLETKGRPE